MTTKQESLLDQAINALSQIGEGAGDSIKQVLQNLENIREDIMVQRLYEKSRSVEDVIGENAYGKGGNIGESGIITDKNSLFKGKMCVVVGEMDNMYLVKLLVNGQERQVLVSKRGIDFVNDEDFFGKGGMTKVKFKDKVKAISERLEGTKVSPKYRKRYGLTYDKEESESAARNIAGAMIKKENYKK